jgi:hypothetical protein
MAWPKTLKAEDVTTPELWMSLFSIYLNATFKLPFYHQ